MSGPERVFRTRHSHIVAVARLHCKLSHAPPQAFKAAVEQWRNPSAASASAAGDNVSVGDAKSVAKSSEVAADLAKKMEEEFEKKREELKERRVKAEEDMKKRLAAKERELEEMYKHKENEEEEEEKGGWEKGGYEGEEEEGRGEEEKMGGWDVDGTERSEPKSPGETCRSPGKAMVLEVLETEVYSPEAKGEEEGGFVVEEESSDEDA